MSKTYRKKRKPNNRELRIVCLIFVAIFVAMGLNLAYFIQEDSTSFIYNSYNPRFTTYTENVIRGDILSADGTVLAATVTENDEEYRYYPYNEIFSHAIGYVDEGLSGLEAQYSFDLLKTHDSANNQLKNDLAKAKSKGDSLYTTLDFNTQVAAYNGLGNYKGAVIAMDPDTGEIIAMVSKPDFDPNTIADYWDEITAEDSDSSVLLNRAIQGLYPPGSTFKIVTTLSYMRDNEDYEDFSYDCSGQLELNDFTIHCSSNKSHGQEDLKTAFANSCNCAFARVGLDSNIYVFNETANKLYFNTELPTMLRDVKQSTCELTSTDSDSLIAQTAIGQGNTQVTPLHMCMLASAIANDGEMMEPYLVDRIESSEGYVVSKTSQKSAGSIMTEAEAEKLQEYMSAVITDGTADDVDFGDLTVYGKTGTAEFSSNKDEAHSWFVGYATNSWGKKLAVAVIMEGAGYGSKYATPLAASVFEAYFVY